MKSLAYWPLGPEYFGEYLQFWDENPPAKDHDYINFEFTATYLHFPAAACRIKQLLPSAKFVVLLRDPVERALSHYNMYKSLIEKGPKLPNQGVEQEMSNFSLMVDREIAMLRELGCSFDGLGKDPRQKYEDCFKC